MCNEREERDVIPMLMNLSEPLRDILDRIEASLQQDVDARNKNEWISTSSLMKLLYSSTTNKLLLDFSNHHSNLHL